MSFRVSSVIETPTCSQRILLLLRSTSAASGILCTVHRKSTGSLEPPTQTFPFSHTAPLDNVSLPFLLFDYQTKAQIKEEKKPLKSSQNTNVYLGDGGRDSPIQRGNEEYCFAAVDPYQSWQFHLCWWRPRHREVDRNVFVEPCHFSAVWASAMWLVGSDRTGRWSGCCPANQDQHPALVSCQKDEGAWLLKQLWHNNWKIIQQYCMWVNPQVTDLLSWVLSMKS